jgi:hypothetical protein
VDGEAAVVLGPQLEPEAMLPASYMSVPRCAYGAPAVDETRAISDLVGFFATSAVHA